MKHLNLFSVELYVRKIFYTETKRFLYHKLRVKMGIVKRADWSKSYMHVPRDNIISHSAAKEQFVSSFAYDVPCPPSMNLLIGWEYGRTWLKERNAFAEKRAVMDKPKKIHNDFKWWLDKRRKIVQHCAVK